MARVFVAVPIGTTGVSPLPLRNYTVGRFPRWLLVEVRGELYLPLEAFETHARACGAVLIADECRATGGGIADALVAHLAERGHAGRLASARAADSYVPLAAAANLVLVQEPDIEQAALSMCEEKVR